MKLLDRVRSYQGVQKRKEKSDCSDAKEMSNCSTCKRDIQIDDMFFCCRKEICANCAYRNHQGHDAIELIEEKNKFIGQEGMEVSRNQANISNEAFAHFRTAVTHKVHKLKKKFKQLADKVGSALK